jgi:hypothetical protein
MGLHYMISFYPKFRPMAAFLVVYISESIYCLLNPYITSIAIAFSASTAGPASCSCPKAIWNPREILVFSDSDCFAAQGLLLAVVHDVLVLTYTLSLP